MRSAEQVNAELVRLRVLLGVLLGAFMILVVIMWRVQVLHTTEYTQSLDRQSIRRVRLPGVRGSIYDRHGKVLAGNTPSYCIAIYIEELREPGRWSHTVDRIEGVLDELSERLKIERQVTRRDISRHIARRLPLPFLAWREIGPDVLARWAEDPDPMLGVDIYVEPVRTYPEGSLAAHILGYVGRAAPQQDTDNPYHYYLPELNGKIGIEKTCNAILTGVAGGRLIRVDASGFKHEESFEREPQSGRDVHLTIDATIQKHTQDALQGIRGACVIIDPRNGEILSLASSPVFDLTYFAPRVSPTEWRRLNTDPRLPLFNRAISGNYAPGSIFKPIVSLASIENQRVVPDMVYDCPGYFELGGTRFRCWKRSGHGEIAMRKAIEQSCNTYFCQLGLETGYERIYHMAAALGLGQRTGIELSGESPGLLPNDAWKRERYHDRWRSGDTCNASIGQGAITVTPLQMAVYAATLANKGTRFQPRIIRARGDAPVPVTVANRMGWSRDSLDTVRGGMYDVVEAPTGTGKRVKLPGVAMGGKTGTAEYGPRSARKKYAWMIVFGPYEDPRYAAAMVVEDAVSGGITVAPRLRRLLSQTMGIEDPGASAVRRLHTGGAG